MDILILNQISIYLFGVLCGVVVMSLNIALKDIILKKDMEDHTKSIVNHLNKRIEDMKFIIKRQGRQNEE